MLTKLRIATLLLVAGLAVGGVQANLTDSHSFRGIIDFGDPNVGLFKQKLHSLTLPHAKNVVSITQFGDSHSAADFFTGELRTLLQAKYGNAGIGWVTPMSVPGQYHTGVSWKSKNWQLFSSRTINDRDFPMGGYIAEPTKNGGYIQVIPNTQADRWRIKLTFKPLHKSKIISLLDANNKPKWLNFTPKVNQWQSTSTVISAPFSVVANKGAVELGSLWLQKDNQPGVIVSMIGTNGAKQSIWQKWSGNWYEELKQSQSELVILEYGTNESFDANLHLDEYRHNLVANIRQIRQTLPKATVLLLSSPDTILVNAKGKGCSERQPPNYQKIRAIQQEVANTENTLYWDWQTAMGGNCIIEKWLILDLARPDLVHLTKQGYAESAKLFYQDLLEFVARK